MESADAELDAQYEKMLATLDGDAKASAQQKLAHADEDLAALCAKFDQQLEALEQVRRHVAYCMQICPRVMRPGEGMVHASSKRLPRLYSLLCTHFCRRCKMQCRNMRMHKQQWRR